MNFVINQKDVEFAFNIKIKNINKIIIKKSNHLLIEFKIQKEAINSFEKNYWKRAMDYEINTFELN